MSVSAPTARSDPGFRCPHLRGGTGWHGAPLRAALPPLGFLWPISGAAMEDDTAHVADDCDDAHSTLKFRRTQLGTLGYLRLMVSTTEPARSLTARTVPAESVQCSAVLPPPSPSAFTPSPSSSSTTARSECGYVSDMSPPLRGDSDADASESAPSADLRARAKRPARRPRRLGGRPRVESTHQVHCGGVQVSPAPLPSRGFSSRARPSGPGILRRRLNRHLCW